MSDAERINSWLSGTPYLFPTDSLGEQQASELLKAQVMIAQRRREVANKIAVQARDLREELERDFDIRLIFESNLIEGVRTSLAETRRLLRASPDYISEFTFREGVNADPRILEVVGHGGALGFVRSLASGLGGHPITEADIRNVHALTMAAEPRLAGRYKTMDNEIAGRRFLTARADDASDHMRKVASWLANPPINGPLAAAVVSAWIADIHPFEDGNGRVSRLMGNYVLAQSSWPCLIIRAGADRQRYYEALAASDGGDIAPLFSLFVDGLNRSLSELEDPKFARSLFEKDLRHEQGFLLWESMYYRFLAYFRERLERANLTVDVVGSINASDYSWLERRDPSGNGWWAKISGGKIEGDLLVWFGFQSDEVVSHPDVVRRAPSFFVSERDFQKNAMHPYRPLWSDQQLTIREVSLLPTSKQDRVAVRSIDGVSTCNVKRAAELFADSIASFARSGARDRY